MCLLPSGLPKTYLTNALAEQKSKRMSTRLRANIKKRAASKSRKDKKLAKKDPTWKSRLKKDPGIPNLFPLKERLLEHIEETRAQRLEEAQRRKDAAREARGAISTADDDENDDGMDEDGAYDSEEVEEDDAMDQDDDLDVEDEADPMAALLASAKAAADEYDRELQNESKLKDDDSDGSVHGGIEVTGGATSRKAHDKVFKEVVEQADVVLYILDARDPEGTRSRDVERSVMSAASRGKRLILVLNKIDLIPPPILRAWLIHLRRSFPAIPLRASNAAPNAHTFNHRDMTVQSTSGTLFRALKSFAAGSNLKRAISVGVIGYPNVGKSSVINAIRSRLSGNKGRQKDACPAGAEAGVTKTIRSVKIDNKLTLLDSPGIIFPSSESTGSWSYVPKNKVEAHAHLVLLNAVPPKEIGDPIPAVALLLKRLSVSPDLLNRVTATYDIPAILGDSVTGDLTTDFLVQVARKRGRLGRGGIPNLSAAAVVVITDWRDGRIQGWVDPPVIPLAANATPGEENGAATGAAQVSADQKEIVSEWSKEFKLEGLWGEDIGDGDEAMEE
jgi:nuclear GTP-binding protein